MTTDYTGGLEGFFEIFPRLDAANALRVLHEGDDANISLYGPGKRLLVSNVTRDTGSRVPVVREPVYEVLRALYTTGRPCSAMVLGDLSESLANQVTSELSMLEALGILHEEEEDAFGLAKYSLSDISGYTVSYRALVPREDPAH